LGRQPVIPKSRAAFINLEKQVIQIVYVCVWGGGAGAGAARFATCRHHSSVVVQTWHVLQLVLSRVTAAQQQAACS
jgi:hypothetical protein